MFVSMLKAVSREGKGGIDHKLAISSSDIDRLYSSMAINPSTPTGLVQKVWFELCMFFCRRGRENQRELHRCLKSGWMKQMVNFFALLLKIF